MNIRVVHLIHSATLRVHMGDPYTLSVLLNGCQTVKSYKR